MRSFKDRSFAIRLQGLILIFSAGLLLLASLGFLALETAREHQRIGTHFASLTELVSTLAKKNGEKSIGKETALHLIEGVRPDPTIDCLMVWNTEPRLLAFRRGSASPSECPDALSLWREQAQKTEGHLLGWMEPVLYLAPLVADEHTIGWIALRAKSRPFWVSVRKEFPRLLTLWLVLLLLLFPASTLLVRWLAAPFQRLTQRLHPASRPGEKTTVSSLSPTELENLVERLHAERATLANENKKLIEARKNDRAAVEQAERLVRDTQLSQKKQLRLLNSHIRLPLRSLVGITELLLDSNLDARACRLARSLKQSLENILELSQESFDDTGVEPPMEEEEFGLYGVIEETLGPARALAPHRGIKFHAELPHNLPPTVRSNPLRLGRLLENLLQAAFQMTSDGEIHFSASHKREGDGRCRLTLRVCLKDPKLAPERRAMLFDAVNSGRDDLNETSMPEQAALTRSGKLTRLLDGILEIVEETEGDLCLQAKLPLKIPETIPRKTTISLPTPLSVKARVLLVEDNAINQMITTSMLQALGCEVELATNGDEAVQTATSGDFDLIFMDCHMPGTDGFTASRRIREREEITGEERIPIIALTADTHDDIRERCREAGLDDYLSKPYSREDLAEILARWLPEREPGVNLLSLPRVSTQQALLDKDRLDSLRSMGHERGTSLLEKAARYFIDHTPEELERLRQAIEGDMPTQARLIAHNLKSSSEMLGATDLAHRFGTLERLAAAARIENASDHLDAIERLVPLVADALKEAIEQEDDVAAEPAEKEAKEIGRVLVVDDDPAFRLITTASLREAGFVVEEAVNGRQALALIAANPPELILLDALMEDIDGFQICRRLQQDPLMRQIPVLMVTGLEDMESVHEAFEAGAAGFITKPVNYPVLIHRIRFQLRVARESVELRESREQLALAQQLARLGHWRWKPGQHSYEMSEQLAQICELPLSQRPRTLEEFIELVDAEDREQLRMNIRAALEENNFRPLDYRITTATGKQFYLHQELAMPTPGTLLATVQDVTRQYESEQRIRTLAYSDELTGLASRSYFQRHLEDAIAIAARHHETFSLLYLDLDSFKDINDTMGHDIGDKLLKVISQRLSKVLRKTDFAARLGGDEFCILLDNVSINYAAEIANRCLEEVNRPIRLETQTVNPRISIGIANYPGDGRNAQALLKAADSAMYAAKQEGKHRYAFYQPELTIRARKRLELEHALRLALEKNQLELHYQPQISLATGRVHGVEALVRWNHPEKGLISPGEFIPAAERIGLIQSLGRWVLETACRQARQWARAGHPDLQIAINISPTHFKDPSIVQQVQEALAQSGCAPANLELEVTENVVQTESDNMANFSRLKELGVRIAIDDFGTGYSSLASLKKLPIDCLKVDQLFIQDMVNDPESTTLVGTIIGLAKALGLHVVAEGVEETEELQILAGLGCEIVQGYIFSRPVPPEQIPALLDRNFLREVEGGQFGLELDTGTER